jgi:hypothetical protein
MKKLLRPLVAILVAPLVGLFVCAVMSPASYVLMMLPSLLGIWAPDMEIIGGFAGFVGIFGGAMGWVMTLVFWTENHLLFDPLIEHLLPGNDCKGQNQGGDQ